MKFVDDDQIGLAENQVGLTFDDVLLEPNYCTIHSRNDVNLKSRLTREHYIDIPIIAANMDTVTESDMMYAMYELGGIGIMHRFMSLEGLRYNICDFLHYFKEELPLIATSVGFNDNFSERLALYKEMHVSIICVDVAHGHCDRMLDTISQIKCFDDNFQVIAGNIATKKAAIDLCNAGADAIKVGVGPGSMCTTRIVTGVGVPQLTAIMECAKGAERYNIPIIADGGIRNSGDVIKALAAGAETVMVGNIISGTDETPGQTFPDISSGKKFKMYRGMASNDAMIGWKGEEYHAAPEGESRFVEHKGSVSKIISVLVAGLRSGMTYCNACTMKELQNNAIFRRISSNCLTENKPHGKQ